MNIKSEIKEAFSENKKIFGILLILFIIGLVLGAVFADDIAGVLMPILREALLSEDMTSMDAFNILIHNETTAVTTVLLSVFFGIFSIFSIFFNGFVIGFMGGYMVKSTYTLIIYLTLIIPHGIIEIPALFCTCASGILLFLFIFNTLKDKYYGYSIIDAYLNNKKTLKHMIILFAIAVVLFVIAAMIEGFITPELGNIVNMQLNGTELF